MLLFTNHFMYGICISQENPEYIYLSLYEKKLPSVMSEKFLNLIQILHNIKKPYCCNWLWVKLNDANNQIPPTENFPF